MIRRAAAVALVLILNSSVVHAQGIAITVSAPSADVYKGPSTGSPVIGHVPRGTVLPVTRELGSWVKVVWVQSQDGIGYVHVSTGRVGPASPSATAGAPAARAARAPAPSTSSIPPLTRTSVGERVASSGQLNQLNVTPTNHAIGVGGLIGSTHTFGPTARAWAPNRLGVQFGFVRDAVSSPIAAGRLTSMEFQPAVVFGLFDHVTDYVWIRPYVGSAASIRHQTLSITTPVALEPVSDNVVGLRIFGGAEFTFAGMSRFGLSADAGYRRSQASFPGFDPDRFNVAIAGHWYVR